MAGLNTRHMRDVLVCVRVVVLHTLQDEMKAATVAGPITVTIQPTSVKINLRLNPDFYWRVNAYLHVCILCFLCSLGCFLF